MKHRITAGLTALIMLGSAMPAMPVPGSITAVAAEDYTEVTEGDLTFRKYSDHAEVAGCGGEAVNVEIPKEIGGLPVTAIGTEAFQTCDLADISIPDSILSVGDRAFWGCRYLKEITFPDTVSEIGSGALESCESLETVRLPEGLEAIPSEMFMNSEQLTTVNIPAHVTEIGHNAFYQTSITEATIPDNCLINGWAFDNCGKLETLTLGKGVTLEHDCFHACVSLTEVVLPEGLTKIPDGAFYADTALEEIAIPETVTSIGTAAFASCTSLKEIKLPNGLKTLTTGAFAGCQTLQSVSIPGTVEQIGENAFASCKGLTSVTIGEGVQEIDKGAFSGCNALTEVTLPESVSVVQGDADNGAFVATNLQSVTFMFKNCYIAGEEYGTAVCNEIAEYGTPAYSGVIRGYSGSTAQAYAEKFGYRFESLDGTSPEEPGKASGLGDLNGDNTINASDAAQILIAAAAAGAGGDYGLTEAQMAAADLNGDNIVNASDAALVLIYAAYVGAEENPVSLAEFLKNR